MAAVMSKQRKGNCFLNLCGTCNFDQACKDCLLPFGQGKKKAEPKEGSKEKAEQEAEQVRKLAEKSYSDERFQLPIEMLLGAAAPKGSCPDHLESSVG